MKKLVALLCVVSWSGFWAFGWLALTAPPAEDGRMVVALLIAAAGLFTGLFTYVKLAREADPARWQRVHQAEG